MDDRVEVLAHLRQQIDSGVLTPGTRLPPERVLAAETGMSRTALRQVLDVLAADHLIVRTVGRAGGTFVAPRPVERVLGSASSMPDLLAAQGFASTSRVVSVHVVAPTLAERLALQMTVRHVVEVVRVREADGVPLSVDTARFPHERFPDLPRLPLGGSLYRVLEETYGVRPASVREWIEAAAANPAEGALLGVPPGSPALQVARTAYDDAGVPFEFSRDLFRGDRFRGLVEDGRITAHVRPAP